MSYFLDLMLSNAIATTLFAGLVYLACRFIANPRVRHTLWVLVLLRLFLPPVWSIPLFRGSPTETATEPIPVNLAPPMIENPSPFVGEEFAGNLPFFNFGAIEPEPILPAVAASFPILETKADNITPRMMVDWRLLIGIVAAGGMLFILVQGVRRSNRFRRELRFAVDAPAELVERVESLATRLGLRTIPRVLVVPGHVSPMVWSPGWSSKHTRLLMPIDLMLRLTPAQLESILIHELAHLRRGDRGVRWLELFAVACYWWFPLLGWIRHQLRQNEEACCDAWVVSLIDDPRNYADALLETVVFLDGSTSVPMLATGMTPIHDLQRRIRMIMQNSPARPWTRLGVFATLCFGFLAVAVGPSISRSDDERKDEERKKEFRKTFDGEKKEGFQGKFEGRGRGDGPKEEGFKDKGFFPKDGEKREGGPKDGEKRGFSPKDGEKREGGRPGPKEEVSREEIEKARKELNDSRTALEKAMRAMMEAEARLARMEGRIPQMGGFGGGNPFGGGGFGGGGGGGIGGGPGGLPPMGGGGFRGPEGGVRPPVREGQPPKIDNERRPPEGERRPPEGGPKEGGPPRGGDRLDDLERQLRMLTEQLESMRREMRRGEPLNPPREERKKN